MLLNYFYEVSYKPVLLSFLQYHHKFLLYALLLELIVENLNKTTREPKKVILKQNYETIEHVLHFKKYS